MFKRADSGEYINLVSVERHLIDNPFINVGRQVKKAMKHGDCGGFFHYYIIDDDFTEDWLGAFNSEHQLRYRPSGASAVIDCYELKGLDVVLALASFIRQPGSDTEDHLQIQEYTVLSPGFAQYASQVEECLKRLDNLKAFW